MGRTLSAPKDGFCDVVCSQGLSSSVNRFCPFLIPFESDLTELCFHHSRRNGSHPDPCTVQIEAHPFSNRFHRILRGTVNISSLIDPMSCNRADIHNMPPFSRNP